MTRGEFDAEMNWDDRMDPQEPREEALEAQEEEFELIPPDVMREAVEEVREAEEEMLGRYPGDDAAGKSTDPDEWDH